MAKQRGSYLEIEIGDIEKSLDRLRFNAYIVKAIAPVVGEQMQEAVDEVLQSEGVKGTQGKWDELSESYLHRRPERAMGQMLQDTPLLANTQVLDLPDAVEVKSPASYATYHITGTRRMPRRDFMAINEEASLEYAAQFVLEVISGLP